MYPPSPCHLAELRQAAPSIQFHVAADEESARKLVRDAEIILGNRYFLQSLPGARKLRWFQSNSSGMDLILRGRRYLDRLVVTSAKGVYDDEIAEHAVALLLALTRQIPRFVHQQAERNWKRTRLERLSDAGALILGWGGVGRAVASRLVAFGVKVWVARRSPLPESTAIKGVRTTGAGKWREFLPRVRVLVLALPLTGETRAVVGEKELGRLPRGALLVNVGRGETIDEAALIRYLGSGHLAGAALDVCKREPLREDDPLWRAPNVLITPHVARSWEEPPYRWESLFVENVRRFSAGEPLLNVVDLDRGY